MPTIKTKSNGKVVLKNGKVSCGCCAQPTGCCLYPWPDPDGIPKYPAVDLLLSVTFRGDTLSLDSGLYQFTGSVYYIVAGATQWEVYLISDDSLVQSQNCLIFNGVEDEFPNSLLMETEFIIPPGYTTLIDLENYYTGEGWVPSGITLTRVSLCLWEEVVSIPFYWSQTMDYIANYDVAFRISYEEIGGFPSGDMWKFYLTGSVLISDSFQTTNYDAFNETAVNNTPIGSYSRNVNVPTIEIA